MPNLPNFCGYQIVNVVRTLRPGLKRSKYVKQATYLWGYGSSITKCARVSKLGLRRTRVLYQKLNGLKGSMSVKLDENIQAKTERLLKGERL